MRSKGQPVQKSNLHSKSTPVWNSPASTPDLQSTMKLTSFVKDADHLKDELDRSLDDIYVNTYNAGTRPATAS